MTMNCDIRQLDDVTVLDLTGRFTLAEVVTFGRGSDLVLGETIRDMCKKGRKKILLNLAGVTYMDTSGIGQLLGTLTSARRQGVELKLLRPNKQLLELLKLSKLDTVFDIKEEEAAAIASFSRGAAAGG
jgi:anti-sigma B factor antagonist